MNAVKIKKHEKGLKGVLSFPGDKSLSHRAIIFGSLAEGKSHFTNILAGEDCVRTKEAFEALGVRIQTHSPTELTIEGKGFHSFKNPGKEIYLGIVNSFDLTLAITPKSEETGSYMSQIVLCDFYGSSTVKAN